MPTIAADEVALKLTLLVRGRDRPMIVCFPSAGGNAVQYRALAAELDRALGSGNATIAVIERPMAAVSPSPAIDRLDARITASFRLLAAASGDAAPMLVGHSFGGFIAHQVAARCARSGHPVAGLAILATIPPSQLYRIRPLCATDESLDRFLGQLDGVPAIVRSSDLFTRVYRSAIRADLEMFASAADRPVVTFAGPTLVMAGADDAFATLGAGGSWSAWTESLRQVCVCGGHFFPIRQAGQTAVSIARFVLERTQTGGGDAHA